MSIQKERILKRLLNVCNNPPTNVPSLGSLIRAVEGNLCAIDEPNYDPYATSIYKLTMNLEELYAGKLDSKSNLKNSDLKYVSETVDEIKDAINKEIASSE